MLVESVSCVSAGVGGIQGALHANYHHCHPAPPHLPLLVGLGQGLRIADGLEGQGAEMLRGLINLSEVRMVMM